MDDSLLHQFHGFFSVGGDVNAPTRPHPTFSSLYKHKRAGFGEQETRRRRLLEEQRSRRRDHADYVRRIAEGEEWEEEMGEEELEEEIDPDQVDDASAADADVKEGEKKKRRVHPYRNQLMMSEWLVDVPPDFTDNWFMTVCPVGRRCLVIANKRTTLAYSRIGAFINCFPSLLPGGCRRTFHSPRDYCILDCILHTSSRTFFVLDLMCWGGHPVYDSDREFRAFWLHTKMAETKGVGEHTKINPYAFKPLESFSCGRDPGVEGSMAQVLSKSWPLEVDGLLFFHKSSHYKRGTSPLAVWLKAHMVSDILGVPVAEEFLECAPRMSDPLATPLEPPKTAALEKRGKKGEDCETEMASGALMDSQVKELDMTCS